jgi:hypothetical protein
MTLSDHLQIAGILLMLLGLSHVFFKRYFHWEKELATVSLLTRQVFFVHSFFIGLVVALFGALSFFYADALLQHAALNRAILAGMTAFWLCRLFAQFFAYDAAIWRGDRFRTFMHVAFALLWCYVSATYGISIIVVWKL